VSRLTNAPTEVDGIVSLHAPTVAAWVDQELRKSYRCGSTEVIERAVPPPINEAEKKAATKVEKKEEKAVELSVSVGGVLPRGAREDL